MKQLQYKLLFLGILSIYCFFFSQYGMENWDTGYIPSFSWRVVNGEAIYEDFLYKGPPITIYFHAFFMKILPIEGQFFLIRVCSYLLFAAQVYFTVSAFDLWYDFKKYGVQKWLLISVCFILSIHNFPPYPWPTTDGLFFASIALYILAKNIELKWVSLISIAFFVVLATFTKQSFYLIPIGFLGYVFMTYGLPKTIQFGFLLLGFLGMYLLWISSFTSLTNYMEQTSNQTTFVDLYYSGIDNYIRCFGNKWKTVLVLLLPIIPILIGNKTKNDTLKIYLKGLIILIFTSSFLHHIFENARNASLQFFVGCVVCVFYSYFYIQKSSSFLAPIFLSLLFAWSSAISVGSPYPMFFYTGLLSIFILLFSKEFPKYRFSKIINSIVVGLVCFVSLASNRNPYRDSPIVQLNYSLDSISPKLNYIKTDLETYEKHLEIKQLVQKYGYNFIVAPNTPLANYIFSSQSELPADWIITNEVMGRESKFIKLAANKKNYIFIEKEYVNNKLYINYKILYSEIATFIHEKFIQIDETKHYIVYNSLKQNEKLP